MTTADASQTRDSAFARGWRRFSRWRRGRPFWGGLFTILSAAVFFGSGHLALNVRITFSSQEFLGWVIPLMLLLCGLLMMLTPAQRVFYGILAAAVAVGGLIGLNLGGFGLGMLLGIVGGALGASWAPAAQPPVAQPPAAPTPDGDAVPGPESLAEPEHAYAAYPSGTGADVGDDPVPVEHGAPGSEPTVGWRRPSGPLADMLPSTTVSPLATPPRTTARTDWPAAHPIGAHRQDATGGAVDSEAVDSGAVYPDAGDSGAGDSGAGEPDARESDAATDWAGGTVATVRPGAEESGESSTGTVPRHADDDEPPPPGRPRPRRVPRGLAVILLVLTVGVAGATVVRAQTPAGAAPSCADLFASLAPTSTAGSAGVAGAGNGSSGGGGGSTGGRPTGGTRPTGTPRPAPTTPATRQPSAPASGQPASPGPTSASPSPSDPGDDHGSLGGVVGGLLGGVGKLLGIGSDAVEPPATTNPTTAPPAAGPGSGPAPTAGASSHPAGGRPPATAHPTPATGGRKAAAGSPSPTPADCPVGDTSTVVEPIDKTVVANNPSLQITADLSLLVMTFRGITELPTHGGGKVRVLEFTMDSSSSTPFELRVPMVTAKGHTLSYRSSKLTVSGHVTFYTTRMSGRLFDLLPVTFTPAKPPPLPPIAIPVPVTFTDATLDLVLVHADVLTAPALAISYLS